MWSHYADRHRGLCLGFDVPDKFLITVDYQPTRHELTLNTERAIKDRSFRTKFDHWWYEKELRLFEDIRRAKREKGLYFKSFSDDLRLREVIIGPRSSVKRTQILNLLSDQVDDVVVKKARLAFQNFEVTEQRNARLWR